MKRDPGHKFSTEKDKLAHAVAAAQAEVKATKKLQKAVARELKEEKKEIPVKDLLKKSKKTEDDHK